MYTYKRYEAIRILNTCILIFQIYSILTWEEGWANEKDLKKSLEVLQKEHSTDVFVCTCFQIAFLGSMLISCHFSNVCMHVVQAGFLLP